MKKLVIPEGLKEMEIDSRGTKILELNVPDGRLTWNSIIRK